MISPAIHHVWKSHEPASRHHCHRNLDPEQYKKPYECFALISFVKTRPEGVKPQNLSSNFSLGVLGWERRRMGHLTMGIYTKPLCFRSAKLQVEGRLKRPTRVATSPLGFMDPKGQTHSTLSPANLTWVVVSSVEHKIINSKGEFKE